MILALIIFASIYCPGWVITSGVITKAEARSNHRDPNLQDAALGAMMAVIWPLFIPVIVSLMAAKTPTPTEIKGARARQAQIKRYEIEKKAHLRQIEIAKTTADLEDDLALSDEEWKKKYGIPDR